MAMAPVSKTGRLRSREFESRTLCGRLAEWTIAAGLNPARLRSRGSESRTVLSVKGNHESAEMYQQEMPTQAV